MLKQELIDGLRDFVAFLEQADFPEYVEFYPDLFYIFSPSRESFAKSVKALGACEKRYDDAYLNADKGFGKIKLQVSLARNKACERVKVGEKIVAAKEAFTVEATPETVEEVYEWKCPDSFLGQ